MEPEKVKNIQVPPCLSLTPSVLLFFLWCQKTLWGREYNRGGVSTRIEVVEPKTFGRTHSTYRSTVTISVFPVSSGVVCRSKIQLTRTLTNCRLGEPLKTQVRLKRLHYHLLQNRFLLSVLFWTFSQIDGSSFNKEINIQRHLRIPTRNVNIDYLNKDV